MEVAIQYVDGYQENIFGFVNTINTVEGGTHVSGFKTALTRVINDYAKKKGLLKNDSIAGDDTREGLTAIVSIKIPDPQFEGQTKARLGNTEIRTIVESIVGEKFSLFLADLNNTIMATELVGKAVIAAKARAAATKAESPIWLA